MGSADYTIAAPPRLEPTHANRVPPMRPGRLASLAEAFSFLLRNGDIVNLVRMCWETLFGKASLVLLRLDLTSFCTEHLQRFSLHARPLEPNDLPVFFNSSDHGLTAREQRQVLQRLFTLQAGIKTCYVVEDSHGNAIFLQWLIPPSENEALRNRYGEWYPLIAPDEAMIEHAYVLPKYRGTGLLPCAAARVLEIARESGVRSVVTFIPTWNKNSLQSFMNMGFRPYQYRMDRKVFGVRVRRTAGV